VEPNADEKERAMGFPTGMTSVPFISESSRQHVLGQAMDLNCLTWIFSLGTAKQRQLRATSIVVTPLVSSLPTMMVETSVGGEDSCTFHPWSTWDVLGKHVEVMAHAVGGVCCSSGVPLGDMEKCVASPEVLLLQPMALFFSSSVSTKETSEPLMGPKLKGGQRRRLMQFLRVYKSCFAFNMELGALIGPSIQIELVNDMLIFRCPYKYSDMEKDLIWS
jgi:hypothetical protein